MKDVPGARAGDRRSPLDLSLCPSCVHVRFVDTARSRFLMCELSRVEPRYPKYPPQPILACPGHRARASLE